MGWGEGGGGGCGWVIMYFKGGLLNIIKVQNFGGAMNPRPQCGSAITYETG